MAKGPVLTDVTNILNGASTINNNNDLIEAAFDNTLSRDGSTPNQMNADIDMNSNDVLNATAVHATYLYINGNLATNFTMNPTFVGAWATATMYSANNMVGESGNSYICLADHTSGVFATDLADGKWGLIAQGFGTGDTTITGDLTVTVDTDLQGTLLTQGTFTSQGLQVVTGNLDVNSDLLLDGITNLATVKSDLEIPDNSVVTKGANYTAVAADRGKLFVFTAGATLNLPAAATAGDAYWIDVKSSTGEITITPNGVETINGVSSASLAEGRTMRLHSNGTTWYTTAEYTGLAKTTILTVGSGTYTPTPGCRVLKLRGCAGGGGGGGVNGNASGVGISGSGQAGSEFEHTIYSPSSSYSYVVGAKGAGGAAGTNNGATGGDTTFSDGGSTSIVAYGGDFGRGVGGSASSGSAVGGSAGAIGTGADVNIQGQRGGAGSWTAAQEFLIISDGGHTSFGKSIARTSANASGIASVGYGAGGTGAVARNSATNRSGGNGADGIIIVEEHF